MNSTLSVAVLSGKGGVGKTNLSLNLACALYQAGDNTRLSARGAVTRGALSPGAHGL